MSLSAQAISLAVLPFRSLGPEGGSDYLAEGLTEEILTTLAGIEGLQVASRSSSYALEGLALSPQEMGDRLQVRYLLEGSVRKEGETIRISVRLLEAQKGFSLWSSHFDRSSQTLLSLQAEIAEAVAHKLIESSASLRFDFVHPSPKDDPQAYDLYLQGIYYYYRYTVANNKKAVQFFQKALNRQPDFGRAYAGLAKSYLILAAYGRENARYYEASKAAALKAIQYEEGLIQAYQALALVRMFYEFDYEGGREVLQKAVALNPRHPETHRMMGIYYMMTGHQDLAIAEHEIAVQVDPVNLILVRSLGWMQSYLGRFTEAKEAYERTLALDPSFRPSLESLGYLASYQGNWEEAIGYFRQYQAMVGHPLKGWTALGYALGKAGQRDEAYEIWKKLQQRQEEDPEEHLSLDFALVMLGLGKKAEAFEHLAKAVEHRVLLAAVFIAADPVFDELRDDPRFLALRRLMNMPLSPPQKAVALRGIGKPITLQADTREHLLLDLDELVYLEAQDNYSLVVWRSGSELKHKLLRASLSRLADQLPPDAFVRCHRSYLVNLAHFTRVEGNARTYELFAPELDLRIPVSRSLGKQLRQQLLG